MTLVLVDRAKNIKAVMGSWNDPTLTLLGNSSMRCSTCIHAVVARKGTDYLVYPKSINNY